MSKFVKTIALTIVLCIFWFFLWLMFLGVTVFYDDAGTLVFWLSSIIALGAFGEIATLDKE